MIDFASELASLPEEDLAADILIPLLRAMGYRNVRYTHGILEHGVDLLFVNQTPFGPELCGAQVKVVRITSRKTSKTGNINEVINQASSALRHSFLDTSDNTEKSLDKFFIITSREISQPAQVDLQSALREFGRTVRFIDGQTLSKLVADHLGPYATEYFVRRSTVNDLAHWLRSPLQGLLGDIEWIGRLAERECSGMPNLLKACKRAHSHAHMLNVAVHNTLIALLPEQSLLGLSFSEELLERLLLRVIRAYQDPAAFKRIGITPQIDSVSPVPMDVATLTLAVSNLIDNAIKYSAPGKDIQVWLRDRDVNAEIEIENQGVPILPEELAHIWEPYFRGSAVRDGQAYVAGVGLGLTVAKKAVELHKGSIEVTSRIPSEDDPRIAITRFTITLPKGRNKESTE
jgi:signal transduction histidine kinase